MCMPKIAHVLFLLLALFLIAVGLSTPDSTDSTADVAEQPLPVIVDQQEPALALPFADTGEPAWQEPQPPSVDYLEAVTDSLFNDFDEMAKQRTVRALVVRSRTFYFFDGAVQRGLSYDSLRAFEDFLNKKLNKRVLKLHIQFIPVSRDQLIPALLAGYGDLAVANITITPERQELVDFSKPIMKDVREVLVTGPGVGPVRTPEELSGRTVHVRPSSSYYQSLLQLNQSLENMGKAPAHLVAADEHMEDEDLLEMVNAGLIPAIVIDSHKAEFWRQILDDITVNNHIILRRGAEIGWAMRKDSAKLETMVNAFLKKNREGTLLGNILLRRYLQETRYVENALKSPELKKFNATAPLFREYADRYGFDWLMIMSQAYQESRLDHRALSKSGAVGIMQIKPSTAADKNVNIADVSKLENNIHAGIKYLRFIRDRYFESEPMDELNKTLFSFAAYNAGPSRIIRLRKRAAKEGLDPNIWFDNVELLAAKRISQEPVQYVSNIYKYWVAYQLSREHLSAVTDMARATSQPAP
jgi:membrane-bound lytic murein transglycosylase MltF